MRAHRDTVTNGTSAMWRLNQRGTCLFQRTHAAREKEWRERDSLRGAAIKDRDGDGVRDDREV